MRKSDESALSIVPSHFSSRLPSIYSNPSSLSLESAELVYRRLSIDDNLFTARVYKRNYRPKFMKLQSASQAQKEVLHHATRSSASHDPLTHWPPSFFSVYDAYNKNTTHIEPILSKDNPKLPLIDHQRMAIASCDLQNFDLVSHTYLHEYLNSRCKGPAVTLDLTCLEQNTTQVLDLHKSVSQTQPINLKHLLRYKNRKFVSWRHHFLIQACAQLRLDLIQVLLNSDKQHASRLRSATPTTKLFEIAYRERSTELLRILQTHEVTAPEAFSPEVQEIFASARETDSEPISEIPISSNAQLQNEYFLTAAQSSEWEIVEILALEGKVNVNVRSQRDGRTCLHHVILACGDADSLDTSQASQLARTLID